jgi:hypothetical protein
MDPVDLSFGTDGLRSDDLTGLFVGWPHPPSIDDRLGILRAADEVVVCRAAAGSTPPTADGCGSEDSTPVPTLAPIAFSAPTG